VPTAAVPPRDLGRADGGDSAAASAPVDRRRHRRGRRAEPGDSGPHLGPARPGAAAGRGGGAGRRYEWERPGQLLHVDIKKLGRIGAIGHRITGDRRQRVRGIGWEFVHVCLDDCSRLAYAEVLSDEQSVTVAGFLRRAVAWFARRGIVTQRVLSDNGSAYRSRLIAAVCQALDVGHRFTRPYTPRTNGKAERFIQTVLREWAYAVAYSSSAQRTAALVRWLHYYNWHRPHSAINRQPPISRVVGRDDLLRLHS